MFVSQQKDILLGLISMSRETSFAILGYGVITILAAFDAKRDIEDTVYSLLTNIHEKLT